MQEQKDRGRIRGNRELTAALFLFAVLVIGIMTAQYRQKAVVIELSLYSGNSWGVPHCCIISHLSP